MDFDQKLFQLTNEREKRQLAIKATAISLENQNLLLVVVQDIHKELDEKETDSWVRLIRVLTHEIMNSVTPLSSLAATVETNLVDNIEDDVPIEKEELEDIYLAVQTIKRRSEGLIRFVSDFRNLTRIPEPKLQEIEVSKVLDHISLLLKHEMASKNIDYIVNLTPKGLMFNVDKELIDQVLINLLQNAIHALDENERDKVLILNAFINEYGRPTLTIRDNGVGIDEEALGKIFIPFFTTKKQGSGIGLSLSKQIMRKHGGAITVKSVMNEGTEFTLRF